jgi:hypothetical protein
MYLLSRFVIVLAAAALWLANPCIASQATPMNMQFYSQASQDQFAHCILHQILDQRSGGYYLEIGAGHPSYGNNTYFFEKNYEWKGISIDISDEFKKVWASTRQNTLLIEDATRADYQSILQSFPRVIDYLSLDIDCSYDVVLRRIFLADHVFKVVTIEHDFYRLGDKFRHDEREILSSLGYYLLCPDVSVFFNGKDSVFEDWWVHPTAFPPDVFNKLISLDLKAKSHDQLIDTIQKAAL